MSKSAPQAREKIDFLHKIFPELSELLILSNWEITQKNRVENPPPFPTGRPEIDRGFSPPKSTDVNSFETEEDKIKISDSDIKLDDIESLDDPILGKVEVLG